MELKKNPKKDIYRHSRSFFFIGLIISLLAVNTAMEWKFLVDEKVIDIGLDSDVDLEAIDDLITIDLPPNPAPPKLVIDFIKEVPDTDPDDTDIINNISEDMKLLQPTDLCCKGNDPNFIFEDSPASEKPKTDTDPIIDFPERQPEPEGGLKAFYQYLSKNLRYPKSARQNQVEGKVFVQFVIDKEGKINQVKILKGIGYGCDEEAIRVLENAPKWIPGMQNGRKVKVRMSLPIVFKLG